MFIGMLVLRLKSVDDLPVRVLGVDSGLHICSHGFRRASLLLSNTSDVMLPQIGFSCRNRDWAQRCPVSLCQTGERCFLFDQKIEKHLNTNIVNVIQIQINWDYFNNPRLFLSKINQFTANVCLHLDDVTPLSPRCCPYNKTYTKNY